MQASRVVKVPKFAAGRFWHIVKRIRLMDRMPLYRVYELVPVVVMGIEPDPIKTRARFIRLLLIHLVPLRAYPLMQVRQSRSFLVQVTQGDWHALTLPELDFLASGIKKYPVAALRQKLLLEQSAQPAEQATQEPELT